MTLDDISDAAGPHGLAVLGALHEKGQTLVLLGPNEPEFWSVFTQGIEYLEKQDEPMDCWSQRVIGGLAERFRAAALFPFGGPPYHPFIDWALKSGQTWESPVGLLMHETSGLFVSFRGALLVPERLDLPRTGPSPCDHCTEKPCLSACPAAALDSTGYDVSACHQYLDTSAECLTAGCAVRRACPVGQDKRQPAQSAFHMRAFHKGK